MPAALRNTRGSGSFPGTHLRAFDFLAFAEEISDWTMGRLAGAGDRAALSAMMGELKALAEQRLAAESTPQETGLIACRAGCGTCCRIHVHLLVPEAVAITEFVLQANGASELAPLLERLEHLHERVRWLDDDERRSLGIPCPFLDNAESCQIHPVRPLACRGVTSTDPAACRAALETQAPFDDPPVIVQNLTQRLLMQAAFLGLARGISGQGLDSRSFEMSGVLLALLRRPSLVDDFCAGGRLTLS